MAATGAGEPGVRDDDAAVRILAELRSEELKKFLCDECQRTAALPTAEEEDEAKGEAEAGGSVEFPAFAEGEDPDDDLPDELFCPITYTMMRDPVRATDGHVYERLAITRWFAQRLTSPMTGAALESPELTPVDDLRERVYRWAVARRGSTASKDYFSCQYCGESGCRDRDG